jgi:hypothetical protein
LKWGFWEPAAEFWRIRSKSKHADLGSLSSKFLSAQCEARSPTMVTEATFFPAPSDQHNGIDAVKGGIMDRLFSFLIFAAFLYHLIHGDHAAHQVLAREPIRSRSQPKAKEESDD